MHLANMLRSHLGLRALGAAMGVAVPRRLHAPDGAEPWARAAVSAGLPAERWERGGLGAALAGWLGTLGPAAVLVCPWRVPGALLDTSPPSFLNFYFAALPGRRGPEPPFWQLRHGEPAGAVTAHRMAEDFDTGPVLVATPVPIGPADTHGLHRAQLALAAVGTGRQLLAGLRGETSLPDQPQDETRARYWPRPHQARQCLDWQEPAEALARLVRAANPWNRGALTTLRGQVLRVLSLSVRPETVAAAPGTVVLAAPGQALLVACGAGEVAQLDVVALDEGYFTGGQLAGLGVQVGEVLGTLPAAPA